MHGKHPQRPRSLNDWVRTEDGPWSLEVAYLHRAFINEDAVQLLSCIVCSSGSGEDDCRDSTAGTIGPISDRDSLDGADRFNKVLLYRRTRGSVSPIANRKHRNPNSAVENIWESTSTTIETA